MDRAESRCLRIAEGQHGVLAEWQARAEGFSRKQIHNRVATGRWRRVLPGIYAIGGLPPTWHQRVMAAILWSRGFASHRTAGALWHLAGLDEDAIEVITDRKLTVPGVIAHRRSSVPVWTSRTSGIPLTDPTETLLDLASVVSLPKLEVATDSALRMRLSYLDLLSSRLEERARQGRNGIRIMRAVIAARDETFALTQSDLESMFLRLVKRYRLPRPTPQYVLRDDDGTFIARPDFVYPEARFAIELQSYVHHSDRPQWEKDQGRFGDFASVGWAFMAVTYLQMKLEPARVAERIRRVLRRREALRRN